MPHLGPYTVFPHLGAVASLSLATDGPIPERLLDAARDYDRAHPPRLARIRKAPAPRTDPVTVLADAMEAAWTRDGCITEADLARTGLTPAQIARHTGAAIARIRDHGRARG